MKKVFCLVMSILMIVLTSCSTQKDIYEEQILAIESNYDKKIISRYGLYYKGEEINYFTLWHNQLKKDNKDLNQEASHYHQTKYYQGKVFFSYDYDSGKTMIGYIDLSDYSITNSYVTSEASGALYLEHINDNYCIYYKVFFTIHNKYVEYYVYDTCQIQLLNPVVIQKELIKALLISIKGKLHQIFQEVLMSIITNHIKLKIMVVTEKLL